jgi:UDP-N-acetylmuramate dehydrogenase
MTRGDFASRWAEALGLDRWRPDAPLAPLTTFRLGGAAEWLADITSEDELRALLADAAAAGVPVTMLGGGSNVLVSDAGVPGVVVRLRLVDIDQPDPDSVRAGAGVTINGLVRWTIGRGLAAFEAWAGTPGTVGGAIYGNAHWGGQNISEHVREVRLVTQAGVVTDVPANQMGFAYDTSRLQHTGEVVVSATFNVTHGDVAALRERARASH